MTTIQVLSYSFDISEPYAAGHVLNEAEAKALNGQRTDRLRNILYKKLAGKGLLEATALREFELDVKRLDEEFTFVSHKFVNRVQRNTLQGEIWEVARESARAALILNSTTEPAEGDIETLAEEIVDDKNIIDEGRRRFEAFQDVTKRALADLMS